MIGSPYPSKGVDVTKYTGGDIFSCFFGVLFGIFSLAFTIPNFKYIVDGTAAGYHAYQIIERKPAILRNDLSKKSENSEQIL